MKISLFDINGITFYKATVRESIYEFDPGILPWGTYILNIVIKDKKLVYQLIKGSL